MMIKKLKTIVVLTLCVAFQSILSAAPREKSPLLHPLFSDHMVLQRDARVPVWGWAEPGTRVIVQFAGQERSDTADSEGRWMVRLRRLRASDEPRTLRVTTSQNDQTVEVKDVLVGDVWLCSGQSNMEMGVGLCDVEDEIASADFPNIRLLTVPKMIATEPRELLECHWVGCSPKSLMEEGTWNGFSAAAFFFGRKLNRELNVPIGLIQSSWGGTIAEAWTSAEGLEPLDDFDVALERVKTMSDPNAVENYPNDYEAWCQEKDPGTQQGWDKATGDDTGWTRVQMPQFFENAGLPQFDGMVWFRREFDLPAGWSDKELQVQLGAVDDFDTTWINGARVGQTYRYDQMRRYSVPEGVVKPGRNSITVRVLDTGGDGGFSGRADQMWIKPVEGGSGQTVSLAGEWLMRKSAPMSALSGLPTPPTQNNPNVTTVLYNAMISPLLPFSIKGAIWYQGESNASRAEQYRRLLPAMIKDWRERFDSGRFPFGIVQLANWQAVNQEPRDHEWAELREAQAMTAEDVRNCGLAVAIDIGDAGDIHPKDKQSVGERLALWALAETYDKDVEYSGPWYRSMKVTGNGIRLKFDHVDGGLVAKGGELSGFAIAGEDHKFVWADAVIDGDTVLVSSPSVNKPVAVRYAWDINPVCNLYNEAGLPAVPFRTDDWPMITAGRK